MAIKAVELTDPWALRDLTICVRDLKALPPYARQLVDHMRASAAEYVSPGRSRGSPGVACSSASWCTDPDDASMRSFRAICSILSSLQHARCLDAPL